MAESNINDVVLSFGGIVSDNRLASDAVDEASLRLYEACEIVGALGENDMAPSSAQEILKTLGEAAVKLRQAKEKITEAESFLGDILFTITGEDTAQVRTAPAAVMPKAKASPAERRRLPDLSWVTSRPNLRGLAVENAELMGLGNFGDIVELHRRFDHTATVASEDGIQRRIERLQRLLEQTPDYMRNAIGAGLTPDQACGLLKTMLSSEGLGERTEFGVPVSRLAQALGNRAEQQRPLSAEEYEDLKNLISETSTGGDYLFAALGTYRSLSCLGLDTMQSTDIIRGSLKSDYLLMYPATAIFDALSIAEVEPTELAELFGNMTNGRSDLYGILADYATVRELIVRVCPGLDLRPNDLIKDINQRMRSGDDLITAASNYPEEKRQLGGAPVAYHPRERHERHFLPREGRLVTSPLPYRSRLPLSQGIRDLEALAAASRRYEPEKISEGLWVFDAGSDEPTWYSLGGETQLDFGRGVAEHHCSPYPLESLSGRPILFHCHPVGLETLISLNGIFPDNALPVVRKFFAATPNGQDYEMVAGLLRTQSPGQRNARSLIAHGSGTTEYTFPNDPDALERMSRLSRTLRDDFLLSINWRRLMAGRNRDVDAAAKELLRRYNQVLPKGFGIRIVKPEDV